MKIKRTERIFNDPNRNDDKCSTCLGSNIPGKCANCRSENENKPSLPRQGRR